MTAQKYEWELLSFRKGGDGEVVRQYKLGWIPVARMQEIFGLPDEDTMYGGLVITPREKAAFEEMIGEDLDLDHYEYQLSGFE